MSAAVPPVDRTVLAGLQHGDEGSLERIFREQFHTLTEEARAELGDGAAAARVVERTFLAVWQERTSFETPEALETFLH